MSRKRRFVSAACLLAGVGILAYSLFVLQGREYYFVSLAIIIISIFLFLYRFEQKKPEVAQLVIVAVMCALAVAARISFFYFPQIKPMAAVVIITGIAMGAEAGFMTGALSAFVSNFYFMQGSWTPFQMFALGTVGFFAGVLFRRIPVNKGTLFVYGLGSVLVLYGGIVDINTLFFAGEKTWGSILAVYGASLPFNLIYGVSTALFLVLLHKPLLKQLTRAKKKFLEQEEM